jgi:hypothetical protein
MYSDFSNAVKMIVAKDVEVKDLNYAVEDCYFKETLKDLKEYGYANVPQFLLRLIVLERMKAKGLIDHNRNLTLQRNLTYDELKFLFNNGISHYFGDFELMDEEYIIRDFSNMLYVLYFDIEKNFIYGKALQYSFVSPVGLEQENMYAS